MLELETTLNKTVGSGVGNKLRLFKGDLEESIKSASSRLTKLSSEFHFLSLILME